MTPVGRPLGIARAVWGLAAVCAPATLVRLVAGAPADHRAVVVTRILGARHLVQAAGSGLAPGSAVLAVGTWVDGLHCLTALGLALVDRRRARAALVDAAIAASFGLASRRDARRAGSGEARGGTPSSWTERTARKVLPLLPGAPR